MSCCYTPHNFAFVLFSFTFVFKKFSVLHFWSVRQEQCIKKFLPSALHWWSRRPVGAGGVTTHLREAFIKGRCVRGCHGASSCSLPSSFFTSAFPPGQRMPSLAGQDCLSVVANAQEKLCALPCLFPQGTCTRLLWQTALWPAALNLSNPSSLLRLGARWGRCQPALPSVCCLCSQAAEWLICEGGLGKRRLLSSTSLPRKSLADFF